MSPRHAAGPAAARTAPAGMFHFAINILIRELSTHLANPGPRREHVVSGGETTGVADVGDAHEPQESKRNELATDRKNAGRGKSVAVRVDIGGHRILKKRRKYIPTDYTV